jgi:hypothetical protein
MNKIVGIATLGLLLGFANATHAQTTTEKVENDAHRGAVAVKSEAKKVGHKTAEVASKGKAKITDHEYKDKVGPNGEKVYIDRHSKYYWVDDRGHKRYVSKSELRDRDRR